MEDDSEGDLRRVGAILLNSFFPSAPSLVPTAVEDEVARVSAQWQQLSAFATLVEIAGANAHQPHGRLAEIFGRLASCGEQLMLAGTCLRDARRWNTESSSDLARAVASRGLAEMANYFALSAAHGIINITLRLLLIDQTSRQLLDRAYPRAGGFPPYSKKEQVWIALNPRSARSLASAAAGLTPVVTKWAGLLTALVEDARWTSLINRRAVDFHQFRPQSVEGGAPNKSPWQLNEDGEEHLHVNEFNGHLPPAASELLAESNGALDALSAIMSEWFNFFPDALRALLGSALPEDPDRASGPTTIN